MKRALLDTGVIISLIDREDPYRQKNAREIFNLLEFSDVEVVYSERTKNELLQRPSEERVTFLNKYRMGKYFIGLETWDKIEGTWENIQSEWNGQDKETEIYRKLMTWLKKDRDLQDRGILLDAIANDCQMFIHENPKDFKKIPDEFWAEFNIVELDLITRLEEVKNVLSK